jgi:hypothetical protein
VRIETFSKPHSGADRVRVRWAMGPNRMMDLSLKRTEIDRIGFVGVGRPEQLERPADRVLSVGARDGKGPMRQCLHQRSAARFEDQSIFVSDIPLSVAWISEFESGGGKTHPDGSNCSTTIHKEG